MVGTLVTFSFGEGMIKCQNTCFLGYDAV